MSAMIVLATRRSPSSLLLLLRSPWEAQMRNSSLHRDVARVLRQQGVAYQQQALTSDGLFRLDIRLHGAAPARSPGSAPVHRST